MQSKTTWRDVPGSWGRDNLRRFRKWCISSLYPNHLLNDQVLPTLGCNLLAERASLLLLRPQNVIRWVRRVWGSNEAPTTTITKYNPEDLRLSKCSWQLAVAKVKAFICSEFSHYRVVKTGKTSEFDDCEKLAIEDGKNTLLQHQYVILRGNSSQSSS